MDKEIRDSEFAEYLISKRLAPETHAKFYVYWVRTFLASEQNLPGMSLEEKLAAFLERLQQNGKEDWQCRQAEKAVRLYFLNFLHSAETWTSRKPALSIGPEGAVLPNQLVEACKDHLRVRHYSYRTEQTYLDWISRYPANPGLSRAQPGRNNDDLYPCDQGSSQSRCEPAGPNRG